MTLILSTDPAEDAKWRQQATKAAIRLKAEASDHWEGQERVRMGFAFDDCAITIEVPVKDIHRFDRDALGDMIYQFVRAAAQEAVQHWADKPAETRH